MIQYRNYKIIPTEHGFDLVRIVQSRRIGSGTLSNPRGEIYEREDNIEYGYSFESLIKKICHLMTIDNLPEDATLKDYVTLFKASVDEIKTILRQ